MLHAIQGWLGATVLAPYVRTVVWAKVLLETAHIVADSLILFSAGLRSLRLIRRAPGGQSTADIAKRFGPWIWSGLAAAAITGLMLLTGAGRRGLENPMFQLKLTAMALAVLLSAALQLSLAHSAAFWQSSPTRRFGAAAIGPLYFLLWLVTAFAGRLLAYSNVFFPARN
jgi:uncharacterized membrane protein